MARKIIDIGTIGNDGTGDSIRESFRKVNDNFKELYGSLGLGERLSFINLADVPETYDGAIDPGSPYATWLLTVNNTKTGLDFKPLRAGTKIRINYAAKKDENSSEGTAIEIINDFTSIFDDKSPRLGANLSARAGVQQYRIEDLPEFDRTWIPGQSGTPGGPVTNSEAVSKSYVDSFVSRAGIDGVDPATGTTNSNLGRMSGPLILSRNPISDDDDLYDGLIAATKRYVDRAAFGSTTNIYVSTAGDDNRTNISRDLQGSSLSYSFRTIEEALKRAEELILNSQADVGPYKKTLTFNKRTDNNPALPSGTAILSGFNPSIDSGNGFSAIPVMSLDSITIKNRGIDYYVGDILEITGGSSDDPSTLVDEDQQYRDDNNITDPLRTSSPIRLIVTATAGNPGPIAAFKVLSIGAYTTLPGTVDLPTIISTPAGPSGSSGIGQFATFDATYKVTGVKIQDSGTGYGLVSVRIEGGNGTGAFGTADVVNGEIVSITITDSGSGFDAPPVVYADLPRFSIYTNGQRTDFTGNVLDNSASSYRGRDLREGLYLKGEKSGAIAQILAHRGELGKIDGVPALNQSLPDRTNVNYNLREYYELFDVDIQSGRFKTPAKGIGSISGTTLTISSVDTNSGTFEVGDLIHGDGVTEGTKIVSTLTGEGGVGTYTVNIAQSVSSGVIVGGEPISYGDITVSKQISILIESGIYEENYPLRVPKNVAIIGDEFRRVIIKPKQGISSSPWIFDKFRRDLTIGANIQNPGSDEDPIQDLLTIANRTFGYHYLTDSSKPVAPRINNRGSYRSAAILLQANKTFVQDEVVSWIDELIQSDRSPFSTTFVYNRQLCRRDVGLLIDAMIYDLRVGEYYRTVSGALKYLQNDSGLVAISSQILQTVAALNRLNHVVQFVLTNRPLPDSYQETTIQVIDQAYASEFGTYGSGIRNISGIDRQDGINPVRITTSTPHPFNDGEKVSIVNVGGTIDLNNDFYYVKKISDTDFDLYTNPELTSIVDGSAFTIYVNNGIVISLNGVFGELVDTVISVLQAYTVPNPLINLPKNNDEVDVFLCNDANIIRAVTCQGHGGFMMVLDPTGQILTKSPYAQESASFSKSIDKQTFAGGMYVDGFTGNLQFYHDASTYTLVDATPAPLAGTGTGYLPGDELSIIGGTGLRQAKLRVTSVNAGVITSVAIIDPGSYTVLPDSPNEVTGGNGSGAEIDVLFYANRLSVSNLVRFPQLPSSFIVNDIVYRINYVRDFIYSPEGSTATLVLDETTPFPLDPGTFVCSISQSNPAVITKADHKLQPGAVVIFSVQGGDLPAGINGGQEYYVLSEGLTDNTFRVSATQGILTPVETTSPGSGTFSYRRIYEILTPGNRSMLANDFTQINDLGYGIVATNGGLIEAVSVFTYYCWISYYSINGGQIRSVSGSSAHGKYALVAQGSDTLELPTPTSLWEDLSQGASIYWPGAPSPGYVGDMSSLYRNEAEKFVIYVTNWSKYVPIAESELEVDHGDEITRYSIVTVETEELPPGVARLVIGTQGGLVKAVPNNTPVTIRCLSRLALTGSLQNVSVRPSTGLVINDLPSSVYRVLEFTEYTDPNGPYPFTANSGLLTDVSGTHRLREGYTVKFITTGVLPAPLESTKVYYVIANSLDSATGKFKVSNTKNGTPIVTIDAGSGVHSYSVFGITETRLKENYDYISLTTLDPGEFAGNKLTGDGTCTFTVVADSDIVVNVPGHTLVNGDVIKFELSNRITGSLPDPIDITKKYHVISVVAGVSFKVSRTPGGSPVISGNPADPGVGTFYYGKILGAVGDTQIASTVISTPDVNRVIGSKFVFLGKEYRITDYEIQPFPEPPGLSTTRIFAKITIEHLGVGTGLQDSILSYSSPVTLYAGSPAGTTKSDGSLTVRISLTRVTGHDLLEIGTGSYKQTNYPNEIYGSAENAIAQQNEVQERTVGRVFYVTTDQYGNFSVGPFFKVDQGTGTVTYSANIVISNLDGLGFKRGVPVREFSIDTGLGTGNQGAIDVVPTEYAIRAYIERRLGISHSGAIISAADIIPSDNSGSNIYGGFLDLGGKQSMKADLSVGGNNIVNLADPVNPTDAVNFRSLKLGNLDDVIITPPGDPNANQILVFNGAGTNLINATVSGDLVFDNINNNAVFTSITTGAIDNDKVSLTAAIAQSKLALSKANTFEEDNPTSGWNGTNPKTQADLGLSKFSSTNFELKEGYVRLKDNGVGLAELITIPTSTVLGNNSGLTGNVSTVGFADVVNVGGAIRKSQFGQNGAATGFLRRNGPGDADSNFSTVESSSSVEGNKIVIRDSAGDFSARRITVTDQYLINTKAAIIRSTAGTGGNITYYGYDGVGSGEVIIGGGSNSTDKVTTYKNNSHSFVTLAGAAAPVVASSIQVSSITTGGNKTAGTITGRWTLTGTSPNESRLQATYSADLAEYYEGDKEYEVGTVLVFGGDKEVTTTTKYADTRVAGVVSNTAAFAMFEGCPGLKNLIALQGRVPCKVVGKISKGDILVTSKIAGVAISAKDTAQAGTIIGKALENYDSDHIGKVEVAVGRH